MSYPKTTVNKQKSIKPKAEPALFAFQKKSGHTALTLHSEQCENKTRLPNAFVAHSAKGSVGEGGQYATVLIQMEHLSTTPKNAEIKGQPNLLLSK